MCKYQFQSPNNPGDPVDDLAFTMFVLEQEGYFEDDDDEDESQSDSDK